MNGEPPHAGAGDCTYFPDPIVTTEETPVLLTRLLGAGNAAGEAATGLQIAQVEGVDISRDRSMELPGIRVGDGDGAGYILKRSLDGQLVFVPDAGYTGVVTFNYTIADTLGDAATVVATVSVEKASQLLAGIAFADGSTTTSVAEGVDATIVGALSMQVEQSRAVDVQVYEGDDASPSHRFTVLGDKLRVIGPLDHAADGTIHLRVVASAHDGALLTGELSVEVRPAPLTAGRAAPGHAPQAEAAPDQPALARAVAVASAQDQFLFIASSPQPGGEETAADAPDDNDRVMQPDRSEDRLDSPPADIGAATPQGADGDWHVQQADTGDLFGL